MFDIKQFLLAIKQIAEEKGIPEENVLETVEAAIAAAYKRDYGKKGQVIRAKLNSETGGVKMTQIHYVVEGVDEEGNITGQLPLKLMEEKPDFMEMDSIRSRARGKVTSSDDHGEATSNGMEGRSRNKKLPEPEKESGIEDKEEEIKIKFNPEKHIILDEAKKKNKKAKVGDEIVTDLETHTDFGRIAAQTAKQVVIQRLRESEREAIYEEFKKKENEIISGIIQRKEGSLVFVDIGKTNGVLITAEQTPGESYRIGSRLKFLILKVEESPRGPVVVLSRSHPKLVFELFQMEVPEIDTGAVEVKAIAREAGSRTKIAVTSKETGVDPIGSLVGQKGVRVQTVINELSGEKIDIISWSDKISEFIANSFSPAKILEVKILDEARRHALVEVSDDQFSLAIGKGGQNVRLAAKLTGWRIDVRSPKENIGFPEVESKDEIIEGADPKTDES